MFPAVGAVRKRGTSVIFEDIAVPDRRARARRAGSPGALPHARLRRRHHLRARQGRQPPLRHLAVVQRRGGHPAVRSVQSSISSRWWSGSTTARLKAEHGTGRNMAPFVEAEWGGAAFEIMVRLKSLVDPRGLLNPGVLVNHDPDGAPEGSQVAARSRGGSRQVHRVRLLRVALPEPRSHADARGSGSSSAGRWSGPAPTSPPCARPTSTTRSIPARPTVCARWPARCRSTRAG